MNTIFNPQTGEAEYVPAGSSGGVASIVAGSNITVDNTDPANPIVASTGGGDTSDMMTLSTEQTVTAVKVYGNDIRIALGKKIVFQ